MPSRTNTLPAVKFEHAYGLPVGTVSRIYQLPKPYDESSLFEYMNSIVIKDYSVPIFKADAEEGQLPVFQLYDELLSRNPDLRLQLAQFEPTLIHCHDVLRGVASRFNIFDIEFFASNPTQAARHKATRALHRDFNVETGWIVSPTTERFIRDFFRRHPAAVPRKSELPPCTMSQTANRRLLDTVCLTQLKQCFFSPKTGLQTRPTPVVAKTFVGRMGGATACSPDGGDKDPGGSFTMTLFAGEQPKDKKKIVKTGNIHHFVDDSEPNHVWYKLS